MVDQLIQTLLARVHDVDLALVFYEDTARVHYVPTQFLEVDRRQVLETPVDLVLRHPFQVNHAADVVLVFVVSAAVELA